MHSRVGTVGGGDKASSHQHNDESHAYITLWRDNQAILFRCLSLRKLSRCLLPFGSALLFCLPASCLVAVAVVIKIGLVGWGDGWDHSP